MRILFFSPFSGIWEFAALEGRVAAGLVREGHEVIFVTCGGLFRQHCLVMSAHGLPSNAKDVYRETVCRDCTLHAVAQRDQPGLKGEELTRVIGIKEKSEVNQLIGSLDEMSALALEIDGIPVGRRALYPFLAMKKKDSLNLSPEEWADYRNQLINTVLAIRSANILFDRYLPDAVICYSSTYSVVSACLEAAHKRGIRDYFIEASGGMGSRHYRAILARGGISAWYNGLRGLWKEWAEKPALPEHMRLVTEHMLHLFGSRSVFVYSTSANEGNFDARSRFKVAPEQKLLLATMSSYDEWFAAEQAGLMPSHESAFATQIEWVGVLFEMLTRRPELFLVLRIHPREFPNRRDGAYSAHSRKLAEILKSAPSNCHVNWPDQKLSLYDLAKDIDVVLNAWSSAGKELSLLGLPVVEWAPDVLLYPPDPRYVAHSASEYEGCIDRALNNGWSGERVREMYRWCAMEFGAATFESAINPRHESRAFRFARRLMKAFHRRLSLISSDRTELQKELTHEASQQILSAIACGADTLAHSYLGAAVDIEAEARALREEVGRLTLGLYGNPDETGGSLKQSLYGLIHTNRSKTGMSVDIGVENETAN